MEKETDGPVKQRKKNKTEAKRATNLIARHANFAKVAWECLGWPRCSNGARKCLKTESGKPRGLLQSINVVRVKVRSAKRSEHGKAEAML